MASYGTVAIIYCGMQCWNKNVNLWVGCCNVNRIIFVSPNTNFKSDSFVSYFHLTFSSFLSGSIRFIQIFDQKS